MGIQLQTADGKFAPFPLSPLSADAFIKEDSGSGIVCKSAWREAIEVARSGASECGITASRWADDRSSGRAECAPSSAGRHEIAIALKTTHMKLYRDGHTLLEGPFRAGTLFVADAGRPLNIEFHAPCEFLHLSVPNESLSEAGLGEGPLDEASRRALDGFTMRDSLTEELARSLIAMETGDKSRYVESVGMTIVMRMLTALRNRSNDAGSKVKPLPRWRLKRIQAYVADNIGESISLPELASVAGLSRMHFAAQFRAATGYRPHEYLLVCRIERAKTMLLLQKTPIVEVALSVGFQSQAHFSTVFKRLTSHTPLGWRRAELDSQRSAA